MTDDETVVRSCEGVFTAKVTRLSDGRKGDSQALPPPPQPQQMGMPPSVRGGIEGSGGGGGVGAFAIIAIWERDLLSWMGESVEGGTKICHQESQISRLFHQTSGGSAVRFKHAHMSVRTVGHDGTLASTIEAASVHYTR